MSACALARNSPRQVALNDLTVPPRHLPARCALSPAAPVSDGRTVQGGLWAGLPIPMNPWTGDDRRTISSLRERMGDVPLITDAPLTAKDASRYSLRLAEGVDEGYAAIYSESQTERVVVYALRFATAPRLESGALVDRDASRIDFGPVVALVSRRRPSIVREPRIVRRHGCLIPNAPSLATYPPLAGQNTTVLRGNT